MIPHPLRRRVAAVAGLAAGGLATLLLLTTIVTNPLASLLSVDMLFRRDYDDGTLEQYLLLPGQLYGLVWIKVWVHWLFAGLPLVLISPLLGMRRGGLLIAVIVLPLYIPVLIFGASATVQAAVGIFPAGQLAMLGAFALLALGLAPLVVIAGLRIAVES